MAFVVVVHHRSGFDRPDEVEGVPGLQEVVERRAVTVSVGAREAVRDGVAEGQQADVQARCRCGC